MYLVLLAGSFEISWGKVIFTCNVLPKISAGDVFNLDGSDDP